MSNDSIREEFEVWFKARFWHECYEDVKHHLFAAWKASRESLVIELPESFENETEGFLDPLGSAVYVDDLTKILESIGLKVKP